MLITRNVFMASCVLAASVGPAYALDAVYIPMGAEDSIVVVDAARDEIVGRINGVPAVHGLAGTPDGQFLIAGSYQEREPEAGIPPQPPGMAADDHAAHHAPRPRDGTGDGAAVSSVIILRTGDRSIVRRVDVPGAVHHVAAGPQGRLAVVTHPGQDSISAIDLGRFEVVATVPTGRSPNYAAFSPDGSRVFVSNSGNGPISEVDTSRWIVRRNLIVGRGPEHLVLSSDGTTLYVNNVEDGTVSAVETRSGDTANLIEIGDALHGIDLSEDEGTLFVAAMADEQLVAIDLSSGARRTAPLSPAPYHLAAIRGAGKVYVSSAIDPVVWVVDAQTLEVLGQIPVAGRGHQIVQLSSR